jgi:hypothetical protein
VARDNTHYNVCFYLPVERKPGDARPAGYWKEIGQAFSNDKGQISVKLHATPIQPWDGKLRLFPATSKASASTAEGAAAGSSGEGFDSSSFWDEK